MTIFFIMAVISLMKTLYQFVRYDCPNGTSGVSTNAFVSLGFSFLFHAMVISITLWRFIL